MKIGDNVLFWQGIYAGSGFIFAGDAVVAVDAQSRRDQVDLMIELMKLYRLNPDNIRYLINTHNDFDHIGGNAEFLERVPGLKIVAGVEDAAKIENPLSDVREPLFSAERVVENLKTCRVETKIDKDLTLNAGGLKLEVLCTPGHTAGSICVYHKDSRTLFTGDTVLGYGRWAGPRGIPLVRDESFETIIGSLEKLLKLRVEWLLPGHGGVVRDGTVRIRETIAALKGLPDQVLGVLEEEHTVSEVSDRLLVYPNTVMTAIKMLERRGRVAKTDKVIQTSETRWVAKG